MATELDFLGRDGTEQLVATVKSLINGGGSTAPDWNASEGEVGHVLNRTHWVEKGYLLEETDAVESTDPNFGKCWVVQKAPILTIGETYTVIYNGVPYDCVCHSGADTGLGYNDETFAIGNFSVVGGVNTGEPFAMMIFPTVPQIVALDLAGATSVKIGIMGGENVHKLDGKFLPDGVPYIEGGNTVEILPECQPPYYADDQCFLITENPPILKVDKTYIVNWNDTEYTCIGIDGNSIGSSGVVFLGDVYTIIGGQFGTASTGEPFVIGSEDGGWIIAPLDGTTEATLSVYMDGTVIHKMDERLLPDDIGVTYTLTKSGSDIKLIGSDGSETSVTDSDTVRTYTLGSFGINASATELNYVDGVTSPIQTQLNKKPGNIVEGQTFTINGESVTANTGAEVFNSSYNKAVGLYSHAEGNYTTASGRGSHAEGNYTTASGRGSHAEGDGTTASGINSHAEGNTTVASGESSHAEGSYSIASANWSHAEGYQTTAIGNASHAEGLSYNNTPDTITNASANDEIITTWNTTKFSLAKGEASHSEGRNTLSLGNYSHAEGNETIASGINSHAEGQTTVASGNYSHAEGNETIASGINSHAEGQTTVASGRCSHAEGNGTIASQSYQHVQGKYNIDNNGCIHIVGSGASDTDRKNIHTLDWFGNAWFQGDVYVGSTSGVDKDSGSRKLIPSPTNAVEGDLLTYDGTDWVRISKADLIAEIIAALPRAEEASF